MNAGIWIFEEHDSKGTKKITLELLSEGRKLAARIKEPLCVCLLGFGVEELVPALSQYGVEKVYLAEHPLLATYQVDLHSRVLADLVREHSPAVLMMGSTPIGSELAPRIAARLRLPCISDVQKITGSKGNLQITKAVYNDRVHASITPLPDRTLILTLPPGESDIPPPIEGKEAEIIRKDVTISEDGIRTRSRRFIKGDPRMIRITDADTIVAAGKGAGAEGFPMLQELADIIGASIGGSRAAVDMGIIPYERQIGISGNTVAPNCLIACGISGAREFTVGMENTNVVVAVNNDPKARIFECADVSVKGDLHEIVPLLIDVLRERMKRTTV
jgi:electron transfer flavoprotein alpha subunit